MEIPRSEEKVKVNLKRDKQENEMVNGTHLQGVDEGRKKCT
jgi:hypothetical protein